MKWMKRDAVAVLFSLMLLFAVGCQNQTQESSGTVQPNDSTTKPSTGNQSGSAGSDSTVPTTPTDPKDTPSENTSENVVLGKVTAARLINPTSGWVGASGSIARTDDGGKQWKVQYAGQTAVDQVFALNGQNAWAVVDENAVPSKGRELLQTADGGSHWTKVGKMPNTSFLHFVSNQEAYAANARTTDGGKSWKTLNVPAELVGDAYFHDKDHGWAVTTTGGKILVKRTVDGGATWNTVMTRDTAAPLNGAIIRSAGVDDVWVECIGESGMSQTSYSLFHSMDGGKNWTTVLANSTAGGGPAPGFPMDHNAGPKNEGSKPGELYVVDPKVAFMGGYCPACEKPNTVGKTIDGGKTWINGKEQIPGGSGALLAMSDAQHGWLVGTDTIEPSVLYTTSDGGVHWEKVHTFDRPAKQ